MTGPVTQLRRQGAEGLHAVPHREAELAVPTRSQTVALALAGPKARSEPSVGAVAIDRALLAVADAGMAAFATLSALALFHTSAAAAAIAAAPAVCLIFRLFDLYDRARLRLVDSTLDELPRLLQATGLLVLVLAIAQRALFARALTGIELATVWLFMFVLTTYGRILARSLGARIGPVERCLVIGDLDEASLIRTRLDNSRVRARVVACLSSTSSALDEFNGPDFAGKLVDDLNVDRLIVAPDLGDPSSGSDLIRIAKTMGKPVSVLPRLFDVTGTDVAFDDLNGLTLMGVHVIGLPRSSRVLKRAFDIVGATVGMLVVGPVMALVALAIRLDSNGPIFFRQVRVGRDGREFNMIKFRSMVAGADTQKERLRHRSNPSDGLFKIADDPRVTQVGKILRRTSLDELPQILNVLRGDMSLVGPRPLVADEDAKVVGLERARLQITPGMTGPWQVLGQRLPLHEMVDVDYRYVSNWTLWFDVKLLIRTVSYVIGGRNR